MGRVTDHEPTPEEWTQIVRRLTADLVRASGNAIRAGCSTDEIRAIIDVARIR